MTTDKLLDHPSYNHSYAIAAMTYAKTVADFEGLGSEVVNLYWEYIKRAFGTNDYPITKEDYLTYAQDALYEWDLY